MKFEPTMEVVRFESSDVIAASVVLSKFNDGVGNNNTFSFGGRDYVVSNNDNYKEFRSSLSDYVGDAGLATKKGTDIFFGGISVYNLSKLQNNSDANGIYIYDGEGTYTFTKKT